MVEYCEISFHPPLTPQEGQQRMTEANKLVSSKIEDENVEKSRRGVVNVPIEGNSQRRNNTSSKRILPNDRQDEILENMQFYYINQANELAQAEQKIKHLQRQRNVLLFLLAVWIAIVIYYHYF
uniref:Transmembrane protein n=1 Tax=Panagrolaimus sp. ES5 TaxID=591445 RepID=A0AC34EZA7_9BILA